MIAVLNQNRFTFGKKGKIDKSGYGFEDQFIGANNIEDKID